MEPKEFNHLGSDWLTAHKPTWLASLKRKESSMFGEVDNHAELENEILPIDESDDNDMETSNSSEAMSDAIQKLQEHAEAIRKEAFAAGYQAAMRDMIREMNRFASNAQPLPSETFDVKEATVKRKGEVHHTKGRRNPPGYNRRLVLEMLRSVAPKAASAMEAQTWIDETKGKRIAYASIRHALDQLERLGSVTKSEDGNRWATASKPKLATATANGLFQST
jgi:hypothetical protein